MISTRRSFVKGLAAVVGAIPLPGVVKHLVATLAPEEQTLEDAEDILRGLIARCVNGPISAKEAGLIATFLARMGPTKEQMQALWDIQSKTTEEAQPFKEKIPYPVRFITATTKGMRRKDWFAHNFRLLNKDVMAQVVAVFNEPEFKRKCDERWSRRRNA